MDPRIAVVVFPPPDSLGPVEEYRRRHDPLFPRIPAHLAVVYPCGWLEERRATERLEGAVSRARPAPFVVTLAGTGEGSTGLVHLEVVEGARELRMLHHLLTDALGVPPGTERPRFVPHITVGRVLGDAETRFLRRQVEGQVGTVRFTVPEVTVVREDARGVWVPRRGLGLPGARREAVAG